MFSKLQMAIKYVRWWLTASNSNGHGMHSPFVFDFIINVLNDDREFYAFKDIEAQVAPFYTKLSKKIDELLFRMVDYYQPLEILNLKSDIGVTSAYLSLANSNAIIYALENDIEFVDTGNNFIHTYAFQNIQLFSDDYDVKICDFVKNNKKFDFIVLNDCTDDANNLFESLQVTIKNETFFVVKNIHSSQVSETNWQSIQNHPSVKATIDLFHLGIVLFNQDFKVKQHFKVRF